MQDPFFAVKEEVEHSVTVVTQLHTKWEELRASKHGGDEFEWTTSELLSGLRSIEWDLQDLEDTVSIVKGNRVKFQLDDADVQVVSPGPTQAGSGDDSLCLKEARGAPRTHGGRPWCTQAREDFIELTRQQITAMRDEVHGPRPTTARTPLVSATHGWRPPTPQFPPPPTVSGWRRNFRSALDRRQHPFSHSFPAASTGARRRERLRRLFDQEGRLRHAVAQQGQGLRARGRPAGWVWTSAPGPSQRHGAQRAFVSSARLRAAPLAAGASARLS